MHVSHHIGYDNRNAQLSVGMLICVFGKKIKSHKVQKDE